MAAVAAALTYRRCSAVAELIRRPVGYRAPSNRNQTYGDPIGASLPFVARQHKQQDGANPGQHEQPRYVLSVLPLPG